MSKSHLPPVSPDVILPAANSDDHVRPSSHVLPPSFTNLVVGSPSASAPADPPDRAADYAVNLSVGPASASAPNSNADSAEPPARGRKLIVLCTYAALLLALAASVLSIQFPFERGIQTNNRSLCLAVVSVVLFFVFMIKMILSFYHHQRADQRGFCAQLVEAFFGMMVVTCSFGVAALNYVTYRFNYGFEVSYGFRVCQLAMALLYTGIAMRNMKA
ncbi:uncharacterized protein LOC141661926 [Apium graveolens]|uniref:uncharacterized protein LOC141661926 n=1 Tax=Apium graveolens TaxID=4045 RepID=UPI003D7907D1